jgi:arginine exporter protein ArgO
MDQRITKATRYIVDQIYPPPPASGWRKERDPYIKQRADMHLAITQLLDILLLNAGITVSTYFLSTSLSLLSIIMTGTSSYFIYSMIRKIYIDLRTTRDGAVTVAQAAEEFNKIVGLLGSSCYTYAARYL